METDQEWCSPDMATEAALLNSKDASSLLSSRRAHCIPPRAQYAEDIRFFQRDW